MNFLFFTPTAKSSAIARMAYLVSRQLCLDGHHVVVVGTEDRKQISDGMHDFANDVLRWSDTNGVLAAIKNVDIVIYQIGNSFEYHRGALKWISQIPGIVCLHDFFLGHLFYEWSKDHRDEADQVLRQWYGEDVATRYFSFPSSEQFIGITSKCAPMTEWICSKALAVATHSDWDCGRVLRSCSGPVVVTPLAFELPIINFPRREKSVKSSSFRIVTFGQMNQNKRVDSVIRAIGQSAKLRSSSRYELAGRIEASEVNRLSELACRLGVDLTVRGEVDDIELAMAIAEADVISCLRWPTLEAASGSAIEAMLHGKPIIVTDAGFYRCIPNSCALRIAPENEVEQVQSSLERLFSDVELRDSMGAQAKQWAANTFTVRNYAETLQRLSTETLKARTSLEGVTFFSELLERWRAHSEIFESKYLTEPLRIFGSNPRARL